MMYCIIQAESAVELSKMVDLNLHRGFKLVGGVSVAMCQSITQGTNGLPQNYETLYLYVQAMQIDLL